MPRYIEKAGLDERGLVGPNDLRRPERPPENAAVQPVAALLCADTRGALPARIICRSRLASASRLIRWSQYGHAMEHLRDSFGWNPQTSRLSRPVGERPLWDAGPRGGKPARP